MRLITIPADEYDSYRLDVIFRGYKHDPQFLGNNTIARHVLVLSGKEHEELAELAERLDNETIRAERVLNDNPELTGALRLPRKIRRELGRMKNYDPDRHIRLTRYDFHPVRGGAWAVSEINSDVPGGFAEASIMPQTAIETLLSAGIGAGFAYVNFGGILANAIVQKVRPGGRIIFVHCTSYSDDRQVMQFLGDKLQGLGFRIIYAAADHLRFINNEAVSILDGYEGKVDAIIRFTPLEWLIDIKPKHWQGYFDTVTLSCNHPVAVFAQTKRFPLVWDALVKHGLDFPAWRGLLPETLEVRSAKGKHGFLYKPAWGRVGEGISIKESCRDDEYEKIMKDVRRHPRKYLAQKRFDSLPLYDENGGSCHVCLGAFCVEGKAAGYYGRISRTPRIDSGAADIPVLVERHDI